MVAGFVEDLDDDDLKPNTKPTIMTNHDMVQSENSDVSEPEPEPTKLAQPVTLEVEDLTSSEEENAKVEEEKKKKEEENKKKVRKNKEKPANLVVSQTPTDFGFGTGSVDDWLNSPDLEPNVCTSVYLKCSSYITPLQPKVSISKGSCGSIKSLNFNFILFLRQSKGFKFA